MDSYGYSLDPYRQTSASYYPPRYPSSYGLDRRSSYGLPPADPLSSYARVPLDPYATVYGAAPVTFQPDVSLQPRYAPPPPASTVFRYPSSRPRPAPRRKASPPPRLGPKKKLFKQTQKVSFTEEKRRPSKQDVQKKPAQTVKKNDKQPTPSQAESLAKETEELHKLFRTGVPGNTGKKGEENKAKDTGHAGNKGEDKKVNKKVAAKKRKAEAQLQKGSDSKGSHSAKMQKGKGKRNPLRALKDDGVLLSEPILPSEELRKSVRHFFGLPESKEDAAENVTTEAADASKADIVEEASKESENASKPEEANKETEKSFKPEEPQRTPEQEKEIEVSSFKFFSGLLEEHKELRDYFIEKTYAGTFRCLVCHSIYASTNNTKGKLFWNLVSLAVHTQMCKSMQPEHRGYGRAVSAILGWDYEKLPKVPKGTRPAVEKLADQVKEETKQVDHKPLVQDKKLVESEDPPSDEIQEE